MEDKEVVIQSVEDCEKYNIDIFKQFKIGNLIFTPFFDETYLYVPVMVENDVYYFKIPFEAQKRG